MVVPDVLMSGHHEKIRQWRLYESLKKPTSVDLICLEHYQLTAEEEKCWRKLKKTKIKGEPMQVIKRDGQVTDFDPDKIYQAILKQLKQFMY